MFASQFSSYLCSISYVNYSVLAEANQEFIMAQGGISLLAMTAADAEDPQTLRMVAGAIANLCGNGIQHLLLRHLFLSLFLSPVNYYSTTEKVPLVVEIRNCACLQQITA